MTAQTTDWLQSKDDNNILWVSLDKQDSTTNVLSASVLEQLDQILADIKQDMPRAVVFQSGKENGFIAGADINEFLEVNTPQEVMIMVKRGQSVFSRVAALSCPTIAIIDGFCMGGGTELALACDYRIAEDSNATRIGLPEVKLGIHPAYGGLDRATAIINPLYSLEMMLSGRGLSARNALKIGLVDTIQPKRQLQRAATQMALKRPRKQSMPLSGRLLSLPLVRTLLAGYMKKQVAKKAPQQHYPAPYALLDVWSKYYGDSRKLQDEEAHSITRLMQGNTVKNLIRVFFLQTRLKGLGDKKAFQPSHVHVVGAGTMGGDIAAWCALKGFTVTLQDREAQYLGNAFKRAHKLINKKLKIAAQKNAVLDRLIPDVDGLGMTRADVIIEAIYENIEAKQSILKEAEAKMKDSAVLATNTSSIPLDTLSSALQQPDRLVGVHFFNPVSMMPLVEIVRSEKTSGHVVDKAIAFTQHIGKLPLPVKSSPGFLVNRILMPYLLEAITLYDEGVKSEAIDKAALDFGMPMGPIELADTVGLDICLSVAENLSETYDVSLPASLKTLIDKKCLGKKSGKGFYRYQDGKAVKDKDADLGDQSSIQNRLVLRLLNEAAACLHEGIVDDRDLLDAGIIFGTGFAPFRGGPMQYSQHKGIEKITGLLEDYMGRFGERFRPVNGWDQLGD